MPINLPNLAHLKMNSKPLLVLLVLTTLALAMVAAAEASKIHEFSRLTPGDIDLLVDDNEFLMSSESSRRTLLAQGRYISYGALRANQVPCGARGRSYYNCQRRGVANPYRRGCSAITHCARDTSA